MNLVVMMGNLTRDVEVRDAGGTPVANFGLAHNRRFRTKSGEDREEVTFVDCEAWGRTAENIQRFFGKGSKILINGSLQLDQWQDKNTGENRSKIKIRVDRFEFVTSKGGGEAATGTGGHEDIDPADIPF